jgi:hypothetical protein
LSLAKTLTTAAEMKNNTKLNHQVAMLLELGQSSKIGKPDATQL